VAYFFGPPCSKSDLFFTRKRMKVKVHGGLFYILFFHLNINCNCNAILTVTVTVNVRDVLNIKSK